MSEMKPLSGFTSPLETVNGLPVDVDRALREYLWLSHGHQGVYGDDGEMQCGECAPVWDYKRAPLADVVTAARAARRAAVIVPSCPAPGALYRGGTEKYDDNGNERPTRYLVGPFEDPADGPKVLMCLQAALDDLRSRYEEGEVGDELTYRVVEMTDAECDRLPEL